MWRYFGMNSGTRDSKRRPGCELLSADKEDSCCVCGDCKRPKIVLKKMNLDSFIIRPFFLY